MPKKKQQRSAFYYFMIDWKKRMEAKGERFNGLTAVREDSRCDREWRNLSPESRIHYQKLANDGKCTSEKKTNVNDSVVSIEEMDQKDLKLKQIMQYDIKKQLEKALEKNELQTMKFYFIHVNWFYSRLVNQQYTYAFAEYAVAEFCLEQGITRFEHKLIHTKAQIGYTREAVQTSEFTHKIPLELEEGEKDYKTMYTDLQQFLKPAMVNNEFPPLYAGKRVFAAVPSLLNEMTNAVEEENNFVVYPVEYLFSILYQLSTETVIPHTVAEEEFLKDRFLFERGTECKFHKNIDGGTQYCSLSIVRQWAFTICDYCCKPLDIKIIPGIHAPKRDMSNVLEDSLSSTMQRLNFSDNTKNLSRVTREYNVKSMQTYEEKQRRRNESKPLCIIDHSKISEEKIKEQDLSTIGEHNRSLQPSKSFANAFIHEQVPNLDDMNFPCLGGRGRMLKKKTESTAKVPFRKD